MVVSEQADLLEQRVSRALFTADEEGVEDAPGPNWEVALRSAEVQLLKLESWSSELRKVVQLELIPVGMSWIYAQ